MGSDEVNGPSGAGSIGATLTARDVMVPLDKYPSVSVDTDLAQAADVLSSWHIDMNGSVSMPRIVLVMSESGEFVGVARRRDILRGLAPSFLVSDISDHPEKMFEVEIDPNLTELLSGRAEEKLQVRAETSVGEIVRPMETVVHVDDPLIRVIQEMVRLDESILPVVEDEHVAGVVRTIEVLRAVAQIIKPEAVDDGAD